MKLEKTLWILTLFLVFVMVIPSVALAQGYDLSGTWIWNTNEVCNDFDYGTTSSEPERIEFCIEQDSSGYVTFSGPDTDAWLGYTESYFIGAEFLDAFSSSVLTGRVSKK
jgi:hypothetical protein